ncbi:hypothetical protein [Magnetococcus sp. PR-3]|uniref:hypothetical protein n=1 Tax=Magnetococcus sp. PR-3 TaxID=3120355 RepID=UPI002FCE68A0
MKTYSPSNQMKAFLSQAHETIIHDEAMVFVTETGPGKRRPKNTGTRVLRVEVPLDKSEEMLLKAINESEGLPFLLDHPENGKEIIVQAFPHLSTLVPKADPASKFYHFKIFSDQPELIQVFKEEG